VKLISSAKLLIYAAASIGACPRSKTPLRAMTAHAIRAIFADSDDAARLFRYDRARCSGMIPPT